MGNRGEQLRTITSPSWIASAATCISFPALWSIAANVLPVIREIKRSGASLHQIADALNARGIATPRGGRWYAKSVSNTLARSA